MAAAIGEEKDTIEDVLEPYLIQQGYLQRTPRGRIATDRAYLHFGIENKILRLSKMLSLSPISNLSFIEFLLILIR